MSDYNKFLTSQESPLKRNETSGYKYATEISAGAVTPYQIRNASIENAKLGTASIGTANIGTLSFNEISGGTAILGGTANGYGVMVVRDESGTQGVVINSSGIGVLNGGIYIVDTNGGTIFDEYGLVSTAAFPNGFVFSDNNGTTTATTYQALSGASLGPFVLTRDTNVMVFLSVYGQNDNFDNGYVARFNASSSVDGQLFSFPLFQTYAVNSIDFGGQSWSSVETSQLGHVSIIDTLSAGTHTITASFKNDSSGGTAIYEGYYFGYIVLGQ